MRVRFLFLVDIVTVFIAAILALVLRENLSMTDIKLYDALPYIAFSVIAALFIVPLSGISRSLWRHITFSDVVRVAFAATAVVLAATGMAFAYDRVNGVARSVPVLHAALAIMLMCGLRALARYHHLRRQRPEPLSLETAARRQPEQILLIGVNSVAELFMQAARDLSNGHIQVSGLLSDNKGHQGRSFHGKPVLAPPDDVHEVLAKMEIHGVDIQRIVITVEPSHLSPGTLKALRDIENSSGIVIDYFAERLGFTPAPAPYEAEPEPERHNPMPSLEDMAKAVNFSRPYWRAKRLFDFSVALVLLILTAPLMLAVAAMVAVDVGVPVVFWQERLGRFGRRLRINKFRTMRAGHDGKGTRIPDEKRSSAIGRFLRRTRLDELPQLFHILIGDMSFIGPRPLLYSEQGFDYSARLAVRPGLTGWAQVHGGRNISLDDKVAMDLWYIHNASFRLDVLIAFKTVGMLLEGDQPNEDAIASAWQAIDAMGGVTDGSGRRS